MRERRVHLERLLRLLHLLLAAEVLDRAQVVQAVGELDEDDPNVLRHRHDHLPVVLRLRLLAALELHARQLRDAVDERGDLVAELVAHGGEVGVRVLDDVVQERRRDRLLVETESGADDCHADRMHDERLAGAPLLSLVRLRGERERTHDQLTVELSCVSVQLGEQPIQELEMPLS